MTSKRLQGSDLAQWRLQAQSTCAAAAEARLGEADEQLRRLLGVAEAQIRELTRQNAELLRQVAALTNLVILVSL